MRILIVAMSQSVHTTRWLTHIIDQGWDIHLYPSQDYGAAHYNFKNITIHHSYFIKQKITSGSRARIIPQFFFRLLAFVRRTFLVKIVPNYRENSLHKIINKLKPDIIHSMETQSAGYLVSSVKQKHNISFPTWVHTLWGSDVFLFGKLKQHISKISLIMKQVDYLICEGQRDIALSQKLGFNGKNIIKMQATGGFDLDKCNALRTPGHSSSRKTILVKGYQGWAGRALVALRALERCSDILTDYTTIIYSADADVELAADLFTANTSINSIIVPHTDHETILKLQGQAKISISLSISDGVPNSMLEAMIMGAFPIQSYTSCASDWIQSGLNGILVHPEDPEAIELAIRSVIFNDNLLNNAASINYKIIAERLDNISVKQNIISFYNNLVNINIKNSR